MENAIRYTLEISPEFEEKLTVLAAKIRGDKSDVLLRSVALLEIALRAKQEDLKVGIAEKETPMRTEIIL